MHSVRVSGTVVPYSKEGSGPGLLLVHGTTVGWRSNFGHVVERFTDCREVITPDYAGSGKSTLPEGPLNLELLTEQIAAVARDATQGPVDLLGDSLGAVVAAATAARHPSLVRRLVLVAGWADSADPRHQLILETWARLQENSAELGSRFAMSLGVSPAFLTRLGRDTIEAFTLMPPAANTLRRLQLGQRIDIRDSVRRIVAPTLILRGTQDYLIPEYQTRVLHELIPGSRYEALDCGHAAFVEQPDEIVRRVRGFLLE